jgi:hypothetical protein
MYEWENEGQLNVTTCGLGTENLSFHVSSQQALDSLNIKIFELSM